MGYLPITYHFLELCIYLSHFTQVYYLRITTSKLDFLCFRNFTCGKFKRKGKLLWNSFLLLKSTEDHFERTQSLDFSCKQLHESRKLDHLEELRGCWFQGDLFLILRCSCLSLLFFFISFFNTTIWHKWEVVGWGESWFSKLKVNPVTFPHLPHQQDEGATVREGQMLSQ